MKERISILVAWSADGTIYLFKQTSTLFVNSCARRDSFCFRPKLIGFLFELYYQVCAHNFHSIALILAAFKLIIRFLSKPRKFCY